MAVDNFDFEGIINAIRKLIVRDSLARVIAQL